MTCRRKVSIPFSAQGDSEPIYCVSFDDEHVQSQSLSALKVIRSTLAAPVVAQGSFQKVSILFSAQGDSEASAAAADAASLLACRNPYQRSG